MRTVGLKILKNKLSEYVRLAAAGETIVITDRDRRWRRSARRDRASPRSRSAACAKAGSSPPGSATARRPTPQADRGLTFEQLMADLDAGPRRSLIYVDSSVALAHLFGEDASARRRFGTESLVSSQLA